jgi:hypothetical protein
MTQAGLIEACAVTTTSGAGADFIPTSLTWAGHDFLDLARHQERSNRAKAIITKIGSAPIAVWTNVLTDLVLHALEPS